MSELQRLNEIWLDEPENEDVEAFFNLLVAEIEAIKARLDAKEKDRPEPANEPKEGFDRFYYFRAHEHKLGWGVRHHSGRIVAYVGDKLCALRLAQIMCETVPDQYVMSRDCFADDGGAEPKPACPTCGLTDAQIYRDRSSRLAHEMGCLGLDRAGRKTERRMGERRTVDTPFSLNKPFRRTHLDRRTGKPSDARGAQEPATGNTADGWTEQEAEPTTLLQMRVRELEKQLAASHADKMELVARNRLLRDRHDLPVDRIPAHAEMVRLQGVERAADKMRDAIISPHGDCYAALADYDAARGK